MSVSTFRLLRLKLSLSPNFSGTRVMMAFSSNEWKEEGEGSLDQMRWVRSVQTTVSNLLLLVNVDRSRTYRKVNFQHPPEKTFGKRTVLPVNLTLLRQIAYETSEQTQVLTGRDFKALKSIRRNSITDNYHYTVSLGGLTILCCPLIVTLVRTIGSKEQKLFENVQWDFKQKKGRRVEEAY
ncbi:hypothetical protein BT69DRAFT_1298319 [Atractiella rhizophila]|nr:hypothetical protein BT69DRAFT_1298319 [Atractiella rhizophila]